MNDAVPGIAGREIAPQSRRGASDVPSVPYHLARNPPTPKRKTAFQHRT